MTEQLELSLSSITIRLSMSDALRILWDQSWQFTAKAKTSRQSFKRLSRYFDGRYVDEIGVSDIEGLRRWLGSLGLKENTINTDHRILTRMYNVLYENAEVGVVESIDYRKIPLPRRNPGSLVPKVDEAQFAERTPWPKKLIYRIINTCLHLKDEDLAEIIEILYHTRLRPGDLWRMTSKNVDMPRLVLSGIQHKTITRRLPSGKPYLLAINKTIFRILEKRLERPEGSFLFRDHDMTLKAWARCVGRRFAVVRTVAKCPHVKLKHLRPSSATLLLDNNIDPETVRESLGHSTLRMLPAYAPRTLKHQREAQAVLEREDAEILI